MRLGTGVYLELAQPKTVRNTRSVGLVQGNREHKRQSHNAGREVSGDDDMDDRSALAEHYYGAHIRIGIDVARVG